MKKVVSVSLGSVSRNKTATIRFGNEEVCIERIGTDGNIEAAAQLFQQLDHDPSIHVLSVGGASLGTHIDDIYYEYKCIQTMVKYVKSKPLVDGSGVKHTLEATMAQFLDSEFGEYMEQHGGRKVFVVCGVERWELSMSFVSAGYDFVFGDLMFALGIPIPIRSISFARMLAKTLVPITTRLFPFEWLYPTGEQQHVRVPKYAKYYEAATVIAGDCMYIMQHMPAKLMNKIINTTTESDVNEFRRAGVKYLVTTTPLVDGRTFGTNVLEAALVAVAGKDRSLTWDEISEMIQQYRLIPSIQVLN